MKVRLTPLALQDLDRIAAYIRVHHGAAAVRVRDEVHACFGLIASHPEVGREAHRGTRRFVVPRLPYLIIYRIVRSEPAA